jgi:hypothetical protein
VNHSSIRRSSQKEGRAKETGDIQVKLKYTVFINKTTYIIYIYIYIYIYIHIYICIYPYYQLKFVTKNDRKCIFVPGSSYKYNPRTDRFLTVGDSRSGT